MDATPEEIWESAVNPRVTREVFLRRMTMGWDPERALNTTMDGRYAGPTMGRGSRISLAEQLGGAGAAVHEVLGRKRTLRQWSESCGISESNLRHGIEQYGKLQNYLLNVGWYPSRPAVIDPELDGI